ncbi:thioredoxin reductase [Arthrobacter sp. B2I5]|jgi:thioredoxin reductase|nr:thioredoxin reductase [Arthrobacter sp. B2I5]
MSDEQQIIIGASPAGYTAAIGIATALAEEPSHA